MTLQTGNKRALAEGLPRRGGFTLIELVLVMVLLATVIALAAPALSRFFHWRSVESEARRFLSVIRYARNQAISEGVPMWVWVELDRNAYGVEKPPGYELERELGRNDRIGQSGLGGSRDFRAGEFQLDDKLRFESLDRELAVDGMVIFRFAPDGLMDLDNPRAIGIRLENEESLWIVRTLNQLDYEIRNETNVWENLEIVQGTPARR